MTLLYKISGTVKTSKKRGAKLGFPTANIDLKEDIPDGIYVGFTSFDSRKLPSLIFIGTPEMFGETEKRAEVYILNFSQDIYGKEITLELMKKLRDNKRFDSKEELVEAMSQDEIDARRFFKSQKTNSKKQT